MLVMIMLVTGSSIQSRAQGSSDTPNKIPADKLTIDQAVTEAVEKNLSLLAERYNVSIAKAHLITARLRPNPVLTLEGDHLDLLGTHYDKENGAGPQEFSARTDFVLERGGKRGARMEVAQNTASVAELQLLNSIRSLVLDVQSAFIDVQLASDNLALARENLQVFNNIVEVNNTRVRAGDLAEVELIRTRVAALQFQNLVNQAELRLGTANNRLQVMLGRATFSDNLEAVGSLRLAVGEINKADLQNLALNKRPDLLALRQDQARSITELRLQLAQGKVDYTVGAEYRRQQGLAGTGNSLGFFFSAPLPVSNRNQGEITRARLEKDQSEARIRAIELGIAGEIEQAYKQYQTARTLLDRIEKGMLNQARDIRKITEYSYRRGEASFLELLDAQRAFNETMQGYNEARAELARSLYLIDSASGKAVNP